MSSTKIKLRYIVLMILTSLSSSLMADTQSEFNDGIKAFNQEDYTLAVQAFKKAEQQGSKSPALYYNLASSYFKLADYEKSIEYFNKVRQYKNMQSLAEYNLGLIAQKQNDATLANKWFSNVINNSKDKKLVGLAKIKYKVKISQATAPKRDKKKWSAYLSASLGYDDNVNFAPLGITSERSDSFSEIVASADYLFSDNRKNGWLGGAYFYQINYFNENIFDEYEYGASVKKFLQINQNWQTQYALDLSKINYGGEDYQSIARIGVDARNALSAKQRLYLRYSYEDINSDNALFDYLEGWRQKLRAEYRFFRKRDNSRLYYELELNNRNDLSLTIGNYSYSPTRHTLRGKYSRAFGQRWQLIGDLSYRASDYPTTASQDRQDDRIKAALYADYRLSRNFKFRAKIDYTDNRSTENIFAYKRTVYTLGISALF